MLGTVLSTLHGLSGSLFGPVLKVAVTIHCKVEELRPSFWLLRVTEMQMLLFLRFLEIKVIRESF